MTHEAGYTDEEAGHVQKARAATELLGSDCFQLVIVDYREGLWRLFLKTDPKNLMELQDLAYQAKALKVVQDYLKKLVTAGKVADKTAQERAILESENRQRRDP